jgi:Holliday junction resolvasome RuvABC DNA-binding subunit
VGITALRRYWRERMAALEGTAVATPLPEGFPVRDKLEAAGIHSLEDLRAQSVSALQKLGLSKREAQAALQAAEE